MALALPIDDSFSLMDLGVGLGRGGRASGSFFLYGSAVACVVAVAESSAEFYSGQRGGAC